jgi:D-3-phosphoglycerate dehydrogenase
MRAQGNIILLGNRDVPGLIGRVGTALGDAGINIGEISWGRTAPGERAMTAINVDGEVPKSMIQTLAALPDVLSARLIQL